MRVVHLVPSVSRRTGGIFDAVRALTAAQGARGMDVHVIGREDDAAAADRAAWSVPVQAIPGIGPAALGIAPSIGRELVRLQPDILHVHGLWVYTSVVSHRWTARTGRPNVVAPHGMLDPWALANSGIKKRMAGAVYEQRHIREASFIHALTNAEARDAVHYGARGEVTVIPNGIAIPDSIRSGGQLKAKGRRTLLFLGRIHRKKGVFELIDAVAQLASAPEWAAWDVDIVGWDDHGTEDALRQAIASHLLTDRVRLLGPRFNSEKAAAISHADAFILPSHSEGLPMAVLEAWAYGLPVVMTDACHLTEGFTAKAAIRIQPDTESIATGLKQLGSMSPNDLQAMGALGQALVRERYGWNDVARQTNAVYDWALGTGDSPSCVYPN